MPRTEAQNAEIRRATRAKIQRAAAALFAQKGLAGTGVQEIADLAGISVGLLYRHYRTKDELFAEMVDMALVGLEAIAHMFEGNESPKELLSRFAEEVYRDLQGNEEFINLMVFLPQVLLTDPSVGGVSRLIAQDEAMIRATADLIARGQRLGEMRPGDPGQMATLFFSSIQGLGILKSVMKENLRIPTPDMMTAFLYREEGTVHAHS